jgi:hypothetical protein
MVTTTTLPKDDLLFKAMADLKDLETYFNNNNSPSYEDYCKSKEFVFGKGEDLVCYKLE